MHFEVVSLAERLASVVEDIFQDVKSISHSIKEVNHSVLKMVNKKHSTSYSASGRVDGSNTEAWSEKEIEVHPDFSHVLERLVVAVESLPYEVRNISLSLKDINENITCLRRQEDSVTQDILSGVDDSSNEEECCVARPDQSLSGKEKFVSVIASPSASSQNEIISFGENPSEETDSSQDSIHGRDVLLVRKSNYSDAFRGEPRYNNSISLLFHDYTKSSQAINASKLDIQSEKKGEFQQIPNKPKSTSCNVDPFCVMNSFSAVQSPTQQVGAFKQSNTPEEGGASEMKRGATPEESLEYTTTEGDYLSSSVTETVQHLGDANEGPSRCSERTAYLGAKTDLKQNPETSSLKHLTNNKKFEQREDLYSHLPSNFRKKHFKCGLCKKAFSLLSHLNSHMKMHSKENMTKSNESSSVPIPGIETLNNNPFQCRYCDSSFPSVHEFLQHLPTHSQYKLHYQDKPNYYKPIRVQEKRFLCEHCGKDFKSKRELIIHVRTHTGEKPYECNLCNKAFSQRFTLVRHIRYHTGEKPYLCRECGKAYASRDALIQHKRRHRDERPYKCILCERAFTTKFSLNTHKLVHTNERPYACTECNSRFKQKSQLSTHRHRVHKPQEGGVADSPHPFLCDLCGKSFTVKASLEVHLRSHSGVRPYECSVCGRTFVSSGGLARHKRNHSDDRPFACPECESCFKHKSHLSTHQRLVHKITHSSS